MVRRRPSGRGGSDQAPRANVGRQNCRLQDIQLSVGRTALEPSRSGSLNVEIVWDDPASAPSGATVAGRTTVGPPELAMRAKEGTPGSTASRSHALRTEHAGGHRIRVTPVPIPNTEVKPDTADGTAWETAWESRSLPAVFFSEARCRNATSGFCVPGRLLAAQAHRAPSRATRAGPAERTCGVSGSDLPTSQGANEVTEVTDEEWRRRLTPEEFAVLREHGTEHRGSSPLNKEKRPGVFRCAGCGTPLFRSDTKFESGTGWPSFWAPIERAVETAVDRSHFMTRVEVHCAHCGGHLGHVFPDGPAPTGERYCMNGVALRFEPSESA